MFLGKEGEFCCQHGIKRKNQKKWLTKQTSEKNVINSLQVCSSAYVQFSLLCRYLTMVFTTENVYNLGQSMLS